MASKLIDGRVQDGDLGLKVGHLLHRLLPALGNVVSAAAKLSHCTFKCIDATGELVPVAGHVVCTNFKCRCSFSHSSIGCLHCLERLNVLGHVAVECNHRRAQHSGNVLHNRPDLFRHLGDQGVERVQRRS